MSVSGYFGIMSDFFPDHKNSDSEPGDASRTKERKKWSVS